MVASTVVMMVALMMGSGPDAGTKTGGSMAVVPGEDT
jgi:hypothetical protein